MDKMAEKEEVTAETSTEDAEKVVVEPYDAADIDFDTFCKSDMRVVKVKDCVAVKKSKKLLQFTLDDGSGTDRRDFAFKKKSPILPIIYETKRGIKIRNKNYSFFMYKQSKRTPFRV